MKENIKLSPTLWRTCRALMNPVRLNMMRMAFSSRGQICVRGYAKALGIPDEIASIYLRQLNSRGLLGVRRDLIKVYYNTEQDCSLPDAIAIQSALKEYFKSGVPEAWEQELMTILRAFSHFNRLAILLELSKGPATLSELHQAMGVCVKSIYHHLGFLSAAGLVRNVRQYHHPSKLVLQEPTHPIARTLLALLRSGDADYYNEGSNNAVDSASRAVARKVRRAEGLTARTWSDCGPMKPKKNRMTKRVRKALADDEA